MKRMQSSVAMMVRLGDGFEAKRIQRSSRSQGGSDCAWMEVHADVWQAATVGETPLEQ
jgi:hypothetical protein